MRCSTLCPAVCSVSFVAVVPFLLFQPWCGAAARSTLGQPAVLQVQMSLDTKRAEIRKLEEQAQQREDALKRSESMLEEDAMRFDAFLKENDYKGARS